MTQCDDKELEKPTEEQTHEPLAFFSSAFKDAQLNWSTFEKEAFSIFQTFKKLDCMLVCEELPHVFTDHLNLLFVYNPLSMDPNWAVASSLRYSVGAFILRSSSTP